MPKCCLCQWIFSLAGRLCSGGKRFDWANVIFSAYFILIGHETHWFSVDIVSGRHDLPFDARAFPLTSFEMQCSSSQLNKGFRLFNFFPKFLLDSFSPCMWRFNSYDVFTRDNYRLPRFTRFRFLVTAVSSKDTTNEYEYRCQNNYSQHVH